MIQLDHKISSLVPEQLPAFIREEGTYQAFVAFIKAYYEWMEQQNIGNGKQGVVFATDNLLKYQDIDQTLDSFIQYFLNDFLPYFPDDALADKRKAIKIARQLYKTKGTPASYQFLFRALYNSDVDLFFNKDLVLRASDGKWYITKSIKISSLVANQELSDNWLLVNNYRVFGETSKSFATIEKSVRNGNKIEIYISDIERLFLSGETIRIVDNNNQPVTINNEQLRAKIVGTISQININPDYRGLQYRGTNLDTGYLGDPVVIYGGLSSPTGIGAQAYVTETTKGSITSINIVNGGYGYRNFPDTTISFIGGGGGSGAIAHVNTLDTTSPANVAFVSNNSILTSLNVPIGNTQFSFLTANPSSNANTTLANALSFITFTTYPITSVIVDNGGGGYVEVPSVVADSYYNVSSNQITNLKNLGILGPIKILTPGVNYANGDTIKFTGGTGLEAYANVTVNSSGSIISAQYISKPGSSVTTYPLGGAGYTLLTLPTLTVNTSTGANAALYVDGILGDGATFSVPSQRIGSITKITITESGEDYVSAPNVSLKVQDIVVSNVSLTNLPTRGDLIYQGANANVAIYKAGVDSIKLLVPFANPADSLYQLRVYNYTANTNLGQQLIINKPSSNVYLNISTAYDGQGNPVFKNGVRTYGDGAARATAKFLNGLIIGEGIYLNDDGQPSSHSILQSDKYNNFTYQITVEESLAKYKEILLNLLHPSGTRVLARQTLRTNEIVQLETYAGSANDHPLGFYTGDYGSTASMYGNFNAPSNNIIKFDNLVGANLANILYANSLIQLGTTTGINVFSKVISVNSVSNTAVIDSNVFLAFANVAYATTNASCTKINITSYTGQYDLINSGIYSNTSYYLYDIAFVNDTIRIVDGSNNITSTISAIDYVNNRITISGAIGFNSSNAKVSISRNVTTSDVHIYNQIGEVYLPELITENGNNLITEDNLIIVIG